MMKFFLYLLPAFIFIHFSHAEGQYFKYSTVQIDLDDSLSIDPMQFFGSYTGTDDGVLIVAGGKIFEDTVNRNDSTKSYLDDIFIIQKDEEEFKWKKTELKIPFASAFGGAVETSAGLFCFGGKTYNESISGSWFIDYNPLTENIKIRPGPSLPLPLSNFAFAEVNGDVYIAGGISTPSAPPTKNFYRLLMDGSNPQLWGWEELSSWDGKPRAFAVGVGQSNGESNCFYLFSGKNIKSGNKSEFLYDAHYYDPYLNRWTVIFDGKQKTFPFVSGKAFPVGAATIVFPSGSSAKMMKNQSDVENCMIAFNTITKEVYCKDKLPGKGQIKTAVKWGDEIFLSSGDFRSGVSKSNMRKIAIDKGIRHLNFLDIVVIALYFLILSWIGWFFSKRQKSTNDYFKGGGRIPWWAAGLSIFGTTLSAITFMAIPAKTFSTDWSYFMLNMTILLVAPLIVFLFIPFYRKINITTAYEYLELRFNIAIRLIGSLLFILFQIGRMGVVLFLPSIALNVVSGIDIFVCIGLMGIFSLIYTMLGGIEAVIWTDVMQVIVLIGGAMISIMLIISSVDEGVFSIIEIASENDKLNLFDLTWSLRQPTVWVMLLGGVFTNITTYGTDQTIVQRYLSTKTERAAKKSVWTNALLTIPATLIFFFVGTALFVFFKVFPAELSPSLENNDAIFPWYIASQLPSGISGLLIAGIFAAAMSSLSSSMNSAATAYSNDIHFRFNLSDSVKGLRIARVVTMIIGLIGILSALIMATMDVKSLWDEFQRIMGLVIGSLGGLFLLGFFSKRANSSGALIGFSFSVVIQFFIAKYQPVHLIVYSATGVISCFLMGWLSSFLIKPILYRKNKS